jgi:hypothetical protein
MELVCLHHHDEASAELKVSVPSVDNGPGGHVVTSGTEYSRRVLAIAVVVEGAGWTRSNRWRRCGMGGSGSCTTPP